MEEVKVNAIYQHYKGDFYKVTGIAYHHENSKSIIIYHKCDENGIFRSIRETGIEGDVTGVMGEAIVKQPFYRDIEEFIEIVFNPFDVSVPRFTFFKQLNP